MQQSDQQRRKWIPKSWFRQKRDEEIARRGGHCQHDGCTMKKGEFAHIKPTKLNGRGRGFNDRVLDLLKNRDCYKYLCKKHHFQMDAKQKQDHEPF